MEEKEIQAELTSIRNLMERSTKFISLSGLSGILAGIYAFAGAFAGHALVYAETGSSGFWWGTFDLTAELIVKLFFIAVAVLVLSVATGILLTIRKAKKKHENAWNPVSRRLFQSMAIPLITGGLLILILIYKGDFVLIAPLCLLFYGLALVACSNYTFGEVKWLGLLQIALGLFAAFAPPGNGLTFWLVGFGLLHIIYGSIMHFKYDR